VTEFSVFLLGVFPAFAVVVHYFGVYRKATGRKVGRVYEAVDKALTILVVTEFAFLVVMLGIGLIKK